MEFEILNKMQLIYNFSYKLIATSDPELTQFNHALEYWQTHFLKIETPKVLLNYIPDSYIIKIYYNFKDTSVLFEFNESLNLSLILNCIDIVEIFHIYISQGDKFPSELSNDLNLFAKDIYNQQFKPILEEKSSLESDIDPLESEVELFSQITYGNRTNLIKVFNIFFESGVLGKLSNKNETRNTENLIIVTASLSARYAVTGGVPQKIAYSISDKIIQDIDQRSASVDPYFEMLNIMLLYCDEVIKYQKIDTTLPIRKAKDYIKENVYQKIKLSDLSKLTGYSHTYLSKKFKEETSLSITDYIHTEKISEAKLLIKFSLLDLSSIAHQLKFTDYSHFAKIFKKIENITPYDYLQQNRFISMT